MSTSNSPRASATAGRARPDDSALRKIEFLLLDVDGVLTDGRIHFDFEGREYKSFHVHDAAGIVYWHRAGGRSGFLSGRGGEIVERRARDLGVHDVVLGRVDKATAFAELLKRQDLTPEQVAYVGDDLLDLPVLQQVGFAATVPEARREVIATAQFVTERSGGFGAARDVIEELLRSRGVWQDVVDKGGRP
ncbi:MAG: 3-deoxy-D-manno-octulosonate 8-phosphate phosphatase (KDO 8-P phosphatase) [Planctomycetota bacterium]|jgi:3-deoxy-D-manno-octulosonate 8-phosphate phosphatase (KDO 8-P phosphatase)